MFNIKYKILKKIVQFVMQLTLLMGLFTAQLSLTSLRKRPAMQSIL